MPAGFAFSPDAKQQFLYVVDSGPMRVVIFDRETLTQIGAIRHARAEARRLRHRPSHGGRLEGQPLYGGDRHEVRAVPPAPQRARARSDRLAAARLQEAAAPVGVDPASAELQVDVIASVRPVRSTTTRLVSCESCLTNWDIGIPPISNWPGRCGRRTPDVRPEKGVPGRRRPSASVERPATSLRQGHHDPRLGRDQLPPLPHSPLSTASSVGRAVRRP